MITNGKKMKLYAAKHNFVNHSKKQKNRHFLQ